MEKKKINIDSLKIKSPLVIPDGFFELSEETILKSCSFVSLSSDIKLAFVTPENYFEALESAIFSKTTSKIFLTDIEKNTFIVPDQYFDQLYSSILDKTSSEKKKILVPDLITKLLNNNKFAFSLTAASLLLIGTWIILQQKSKPTDYLSTISKEVLRNYVIEESTVDDLEEQIAVNEVNEVIQESLKIEKSINKVELQNEYLEELGDDI